MNPFFTRLNSIINKTSINAAYKNWKTDRMNNTDIVLEAFFDESGTTGNKIDPNQPNLLFACIVIPDSKKESFWASADVAWNIAGNILNQKPDTIELKGSEIYGWNKTFKNIELPIRLQILDVIFSAIIQHSIQIFWDGSPKDIWEEFLKARNLNNDQHPLYKSLLFGFCSELYPLLDVLYQEGKFLIVGDENTWIKNGERITLGEIWKRLVNNGIHFCSSKKVPGLQIADILVHTLYRSNKYFNCVAPKMSKSDLLAEMYYKRIADANLWVNISEMMVNLNNNIHQKIYE